MVGVPPKFATFVKQLSGWYVGSELNGIELNVDDNILKNNYYTLKEIFLSAGNLFLSFFCALYNVQVSLQKTVISLKTCQRNSNSGIPSVSAYLKLPVW